MGRRPKINGYITRQQLNAIERSGATINRVLEQLLTAESVQMRAVLIAQGAIAVNKIMPATQVLKAIWLMESDDDGEDNGI